MTKTVRARTMDRALCLVGSDIKAQDPSFFRPKECLFQELPKDPKYIYVIQYNKSIWAFFDWAKAIKPNKRDTNYFDIDHLARLAEEESYTMPRGLTREQRREWARKNLNR